MRLLTRCFSVAVLMAAWHISIPLADAQVEVPPPRPSTPAANIPDQKLDAAAAALERVTTLQKAYRQQLAEAPTQGDRERIVTEANGAVTKAVADQGLSVEEYSSILKMAQNDPEVRGKLLQRLRPSPNDQN